MAIGEQRVFRAKGKWWVAQVASAGGMSVGGIPRYSSEGVYFSTIAEESGQTRLTHINAGELNRLAHRAVVRLLRSAEAFPSFLRLKPIVSRDWSDHEAQWKVTDADELQWVIRHVQGLSSDAAGLTTTTEVLECACSDDSALHGRITFANPETFTAFIQLHGETGMKNLVESIRGQFKPEPSPTPLRKREIEEDSDSE